MTTASPITMYWRPGCGFCAALQRRLDAVGISYEGVNIWEDPEGAAYVRSVNGGNELFPTVTVGSQVLSNPSADDVIGLAQSTGA